MSVVEIESELKKMTDGERLLSIEMATQLIRREFSGKRTKSLEQKRLKLRDSAEAMLSEYANGKELTAMMRFADEILTHIEWSAKLSQTVTYC